MPVNCALLPVQLRPSLSKVSQDQMDQEEQLNMILIWPSVFIVDFVKLPVQLMLSLKDQTFKTLPSLMKSFSIVKKNYFKMVTDGSHNSQETSNLKLEVDSLLIDIFLLFFIAKYLLRFRYEPIYFTVKYMKNSLKYWYLFNQIFSTSQEK